MSRENLVLAAILSAGAGVVLLWAFDPATSGLFPSCPLRYLTGLYCPGCGSLRAVHQLLHGNLRAAWAMNPLMILLLPFLSYGLTSEALSIWRGKGLPQRFIPAGWIWGLFGIIVLFGIARNFPLYPFSLLAPGGMGRF